MPAGMNQLNFGRYSRAMENFKGKSEFTDKGS